MPERQPTKPVGQPSSKPAKHPTDVRIRSVKFNVLMNMIVTTSSVIFPLITVPYVSRVLSTGGTGHVAFAQSVASYFSLVALLALPTTECASALAYATTARNYRARCWELLVILACSTTMVFAVYLACLFTVPKMNAQFGLFALSAGPSGFPRLVWNGSTRRWNNTNTSPCVAYVSNCWHWCSCSLLYGSAATT